MDYLPISALNDFLYCERRAHLKFVDGLRGTNEHTLIGDLAHEAVDTPGYEHRAGWQLLRALPLYSDALGLTGKADLVEVRRDPATSRIVEARPVEYKKGPKRKFDNDEAQLCAQALCLEEMLGIEVPEGAIFHASSQTRRQVEFTPSLRSYTLDALRNLRDLLEQSTLPSAILKPQCDGCSLHSYCCPEAPSAESPDLFRPTLQA